MSLLGSVDGRGVRGLVRVTPVQEKYVVHGTERSCPFHGHTFRVKVCELERREEGIEGSGWRRGCDYVVRCR
jgi:hypothetical protein